VGKQTFYPKMFTPRNELIVYANSLPGFSGVFPVFWQKVCSNTKISTHFCRNLKTLPKFWHPIDKIQYFMRLLKTKTNHELKILFSFSAQTTNFP